MKPLLHSHRAGGTLSKRPHSRVTRTARLHCKPQEQTPADALPQQHAPLPPNQQHVGFINGEKHVFDEAIPHDPDLISDLKKAVQRTLSGRIIAMEDAAEEAARSRAQDASVQMPNRHVGYINGVLHVFDDNIPEDPTLSRELAAARDALMQASRRTAMLSNSPPGPASINAVPPVTEGAPQGASLTDGGPRGPVSGPIYIIGPQGGYQALDSTLLGNVVPLGPAGGPTGLRVGALEHQEPAPPPVAGSPGSSAFLTPPQLYDKVAELGLSKATLPFSKVFLLGVLAGSYTAFGATLALSVGGQCPGLAASNPGLQKAIFGLYGLPFGAMMAVICGAELFTGNTGFWAAALFEKRVSGKQVAKAGLASYLGNAVGAALLVTLVGLSGIFGTPTASAGAIAIAKAKVSLPWYQAFVRAILANWLLSLAMMMAAAASSVVGKAVATLVPISAFVTMGLEHSIANMYFISIGMVLGAPVTIWQFLVHNLLPVTLGNVVGGTLCCALSYSIGFGTIGERKKTRTKRPAA